MADPKVAVVTGGGRGIGRALANAFAGARYHVVIAGRDEDALAETVSQIGSAGGTGEYVLADVREQEQLRTAAEGVRGSFGAANVVVACSGISGPTAPLWEIEPQAWDDTLSTNLTGVYRTARAFLPDMIERGSGSMVVIGSVTGKRPLWGRTPYAASKLGLVALVRTLALELGPYGLRVNLISPGPTAGKRLERVFREQARATSQTYEEIEAAFVVGSPLKRLVEPKEVASCAVFLASEEAAAITGEDLNVAGGWVMY
jgi:NAD(P)-dependent dehydrogenase (short-subunit alcohol dehydrogenase family)